MVDVTGTYTAEMAPGSGSFHNDTNYRLRAAVVETPKGNYFVKLAGPSKTIARWDQAEPEHFSASRIILCFASALNASVRILRSAVTILNICKTLHGKNRNWH